MARPIEATPTLYGEDAERLIASLADRCSSEEAQRRQKAATRYLANMTRRSQTTKERYDVALVCLRDIAEWLREVPLPGARGASREGMWAIARDLAERVEAVATELELPDVRKAIGVGEADA